MSPKSVHYINDDNEWEDINTKIVPAESNSYSYTNQTNNIKSWFPADISQKGLKIVTEEGKLLLGENLRMSWSGVGGELIKSEKFKSPDLQVNQNKIVYKNVLPYVHNEYIVQADKLKHNIILEEKPFIPEDAEYLLFSEEVVLPENWSIDFDDHLKGLVILKENKEIYLEVPFPDIYEANNRSVTTDERTSGFDLIQLSSNKYQINTKISQEWLQERKYPVIVDPTLILNGSSSGYMRQEYTYQYVDRASVCGYDYTTNNSNYYAYNNTSARIATSSSTRSEQTSFDCKYGWRGTKYYKTTYTTVSNYYRGWIKYNTSTIPDTGIINSVEFSANVSGGYMGELRTNFYASGAPGPYSNNGESNLSITNGGYLGFTNYSDAGQYSYIVLNAHANSEVQELLPNNYFQIGLYGSLHDANTQFKLFDTNASFLRITYVDGCQSPVAAGKDITVQLGAEGNANITAEDVDNGSIADCGLESMVLTKTNFTCNDIGDNPATLTVTDINGTISSYDVTVTVEDNVNPAAIAQDITVQLDALGTVAITPEDIDNGSNDACGIADLALDVTSFDCSNIGANTVTLTVTDNNNNVSTATATVTVEDNVDPVAIIQDITVQLDALGEAIITPADIDNGSNDACGIADLALDVTSFDCSNVGANPVTLTVTDNNNNVSTATATVTVEDNVDPAAITQDITVQLDASGAATI
ncbi:MAG: hypothetical protein R3218_00510, partial [Christiangramia sp.]|nr:hypothetical protein [Christiangramia sp.]